jgi:threonine aldolase
MIDLRSDTVTKPSDAMRQAMIEAEVGDDVLDGDPTTRRLEERVAELFGREGALFFPSGTQANQTAVWILSEPGTEILLEQNAHLIHYELAALAAFSGVQPRPVATPDGILTAALAEARWRGSSRFTPRISVMAAENTHNASGGRAFLLETWFGLVDLARRHSVPLHLDGARIWNAAAARGVSLERVTEGADTVMVSFSKGLGCPVGSCLIGDTDAIDRAWEVRKRLGGGMRQTGMLAAACLYALDHHLGRLADDHDHAQLLATRLGDSGISVIPPETNIVMFDLPGGLDAATGVARLEAAGVRVVEFGPSRLRAVLHMDVSREAVERAADMIATALAA